MKQIYTCKNESYDKKLGALMITYFYLQILCQHILRWRVRKYQNKFLKQSFIAKESENKQEKYARLKRKFM